MVVPGAEAPVGEAWSHPPFGLSAFFYAEVTREGEALGERHGRGGHVHPCWCVSEASQYQDLRLGAATTEAKLQPGAEPEVVVAADYGFEPVANCDLSDGQVVAAVDVTLLIEREGASVDADIWCDVVVHGEDASGNGHVGGVDSGEAGEDHGDGDDDSGFHFVGLLCVSPPA
ncbi:MAG: hypothetical protein BWY19_00039 [bacterium ADurb.Bin212]|nr:MAG: hypothetical protein BWY19_00039 [bacterium ADurb.Bin212]